MQSCLIRFLALRRRLSLGREPVEGPLHRRHPSFDRLQQKAAEVEIGG
jgi:hypothetical protein